MAKFDTASGSAGLRDCKGQGIERFNRMWGQLEFQNIYPLLAGYVPAYP